MMGAHILASGSICKKCGATPESMDEKCTMECMPPPNMRAVEKAIADARAAMTRPPVGSTGTLDYLQVEPGDVVQCTSGTALWPSISQAITPEGWVFDAEGCSWGPNGAMIPGYPCCPEFRLISRANQDQPAHIITHEGRTFDLTALETPFGLLPEPVQDAIRAWPHGIVWYDGIWCKARGRCYADAYVYRAVPAPAETRVQCYRGEYYERKEHGTCIKSPDGSIDWQSWRDAE